MTGDAIGRLGAEASRGDYASMARLARALYEAGLGPREVLARCYGVDFPEEVFVLAEAGPLELHLAMEFTNQPWELAIPPARRGPAAEPDVLDDLERRIFARDPDLVPLGLVIDTDSRWVEHVLCYRLVEVAAGRSTVFGTGSDLAPRDDVVRCGDSLLEVLHEVHVDALRGLERKWGHPSNRGSGSIELSDLTEARKLIERVEELQRTAAARSA